MNIIECIMVGLASLRRNPLRSGLTILGIAIGVGAVVSMVSVGDGSRALVLGEIERTGGLTMIEITRNDWDRQSGTFSRRAGRTLRRWRRKPCRTPRNPRYIRNHGKREECCSCGR